MATATPDRDTIRSFLDWIWGDVPWERRATHLVTSVDVQNDPAYKGNFTCAWHPMTPQGLDGMVAQQAARSPDKGTFYSVGCMRTDRRSEYVRGRKQDVYALPAVWLDLDCKEGEHAQEALPTMTELEDALRTFPLPPSATVSTGGGMHAYWKLDTPHILRGALSETETSGEAIAHAESFMTRLLAMMHAHVAREGWQFDRLGDVTRVLRLPGTINAKYGTLVTLRDDTGPQYSLAQLDEALPPFEALPESEKTRATAGRTRLTYERTPSPHNISLVLKHYGIKLTHKGGDEWEGEHPTHGSSTGTNFNVNLVTGLWKCFRHEPYGGDALDLIALKEGFIAHCGDPLDEGVTFPKVKAKAKEIGLHVPDVEKPDPDSAAGNGTRHADNGWYQTPLSDTYNAECFVADHGEDVRYCFPWQKWFVWTGRLWALDDTSEVTRRAKATIRAMGVQATQALAHANKQLQQDMAQGDLNGDVDDASERLKKEVKRLTATIGHVQKSNRTANIKALLDNAASEPGVPILPAALDADTWVLNCRNGTLDLRTGELRPHARQDYLTKVVPVDYDPGATCRTWLRFLLEVFRGDRAVVRFMQRAIGYALTGETSEQCLFLLHGTGANGKSTFLNTLLALFGDYGAQAEFSSFLHRPHDPNVRNDLAALRGARLVSAVEAAEGKRFAEALVKQLTGGDPITARFLHKEFFTYRPQFTLFLAANHKPQIRGTDHAIWRRIRLVPFTVTIPEDKQDPELEAKLRAELPGILRWAMQGCLQWQKKRLKPPETVTRATAGYRAEMDTLGAFIDERCYVGNVRAQSADLYKAYQEWCEGNGEHAIPNKLFSQRLEERGIKKTTSRGKRFWSGIGLHAKPSHHAKNGEGGAEGVDFDSTPIQSIDNAGVTPCGVEGVESNLHNFEISNLPSHEADLYKVDSTPSTPELQETKKQEVSGGRVSGANPLPPRGALSCPRCGGHAKKVSLTRGQCQSQACKHLFKFTSGIG